MKRALLLFLLIIQLTSPLFGQKQQDFIWGDALLSSSNGINTGEYFFNLENGFTDFSNYNIPTFSTLLTEQVNDGEITPTILSYKTEPLTSAEKKVALDKETIPSSPLVKAKIVTIRKKKYVSIVIPCLIKQNGELKKLSSITYNYTISSKKNALKTKATSASYESINFSSGKWSKYGVIKTGIHKISYEELRAKNIITNEINSSSINLYGSEGKMIPFQSNQEKPNLLNPLNIKISDGGDGIFNAGDYLLFYGEAAKNSFYDATSNKFLFNNNYYSDTNFVFLNVDDKSPKRIPLVSNSNSPVATFTTSDVFYHHEIDEVNFIKSGRIWVGEDFQTENPIKFTIPTQHVNTENIWLKVKACARSLNSINNMISVIVNGDTVGDLTFPIVSTIYHNDYVKFNTSEINLTTPSNKLELEFYYKKPDVSSMAWLDYFSLNYKLENNLNDTSIIFQRKDALLNLDVYSYSFSSSKNEVQVWQIDDFSNVNEISLIKNGTNYSFVANSTSAKKFIAFTPQQAKEAVYISKVEPQQLNYNITPEYLIVSPPKFMQLANELADFHRTNSKLKTLVVNSEYIYNMHSSGRKEATAIRDYIKYLYDHPQGTDSLKYVLLFGSGSYDPKNRIPGNLDLIPTYQSENSIKLTSSYVTDDFYGVLDDNEGDFNNNDQLDISVGRLPVRTLNDAQVAIEKIKEYYGFFSETKSNKENYTNKGSWRNNILFVADDGDGNEHMRQAENIAEMIDTTLPQLNISKIFIDSYLKENNPSGTTANSTKNDILRKIEEGALILNYTGHGGEYGWASERIIDVNSILKLSNREHLPLVMTATCEFSRFDDPQRVSAGEYMFLQKDGGAIALFTTVRLVFSIPNFNLNKQLYNVLKEESNNDVIRIGDIFRKTKTKNNAGTNDRNFTLLGDPVIPLALPKNRILLDSIVAWNQSKTDTLKALTQATIFGKITNNSLVTDFNGKLEIKIFDKKISNTTLDNANTGNPFTFNSQNSLLYKGSVTVNGGYFTGDIIVPKNILSNFGNAKFSFYAENQTSDASGFNKTYVLGGIDNNAPEDNTGPELAVFLNDTNFSFGDRVTPDPWFIGQLKDENGINITSNNIQHNLVLTVDQSAEQDYILNNEYKTDQNTFKSGSVSFPITGLKNGNHSLEFSASDNYNNRSSQYTEFVIIDNAELALEHVLNYPNPFTTSTNFYFEQNQLNSNLDVLIQIYTISGKLIKTILTNADAHQKRIGPINWDGKDDYGDAIGRGVYIYKIKVNTENGTTAEQIEKLVILK